MTPGSAKVNLLIENTTNRNITIPAKAIVCQLNLANKILKILLPTCNEDKPEEWDSKFDDFSPSQVDLDDSDIGLTFEKIRAHQVLAEYLGEDLDEDFRDKTCHGEPNPELVPDFTPQKKMSK